MNLSETKLINRPCAICGIYNQADKMFAARLSEEDLDEQAFSARRFYYRKIHFQFVRCRNCGLLRSDPMADPSLIAKLYESSHFSYDPEVDNLRRTYGHYLSRASRYLPRKDRLLEIGCGNGFFLEEAVAQGFGEVMGVEPSEEAVAKAKPEIHPRIKLGFFNKPDYPENSFDVVCIFQTLDHLFDPASVLKDCYDLLRPGGLILAINHNASSWSAKLLKESSPIFDIEHTYLYDFSTARKMFEKNFYQVIDIFPVRNRYSINYLFSLLPLRPVWLKRGLNNVLKFTGISKVPLWLPLGNLGIIAKKTEFIMRNAFINTLFQLAKKDKNIFLLNGDLGFSVLEEFNKTYPTRAWNMGVAEADGHNLRQLQTLLQKVPFEKEKPSLIVAHTVKGKGVSFMENKLEWHYRTPSEAEAEMAIKEIENL